MGYGVARTTAGTVQVWGAVGCDICRTHAKNDGTASANAGLDCEQHTDATAKGCDVTLPVGTARAWSHTGGAGHGDGRTVRAVGFDPEPGALEDLDLGELQVPPGLGREEHSDRVESGGGPACMHAAQIGHSIGVQ